MRSDGMTKVYTLFADLFTYVLLFEQTHLQGEFQPSYEQVRQDITGLLQREKATAKRQGMLDKDFQDAWLCRGGLDRRNDPQADNLEIPSRMEQGILCNSNTTRSGMPV